MYLLTMDILILAILSIVLIHTFVFVYIAEKIEEESSNKYEMIGFKAYFIFVVSSMLFNAYLMTQNKLIFFNLSDIGYIIAGFLLVFALIESARTLRVIFSALIVSSILVMTNVYFADHTVFITIRALYSVIIYGFLSRAVIGKGRRENNLGYYILAVAFGLQIVASFILGYELVNRSEILAQSTMIISSVIGYLLVGIGFMSKNLILKHNEMLYLAFYDALTGLHNRRGLDHLLQGLNPLIQRENKELSVVEIDIDFFKEINDRYGHDVGDIVLKVFADNLDKFKRESDIFCRFGGEEFILILPYTGKDDAKKLVERLRISIEQLTIPIKDKNISLTASMGIATERGVINFNEMLKQSDQALYYSKKMGRNCSYHVLDIG